MKHFSMAAVVARTKFYSGMVAGVALVATVIGVMKAGHVGAVEDVVAHVWHWVAHFTTDVASAEVGAAVLFRVFGAMKE